MKGLRKKIMALAMAAALAMTTLVGCAGVEDSDIVATVNDSKITVAMANFYARLQQPGYESYYESYQDYMQQMTYGSVIQETEIDWNAVQEDGKTMEETFKKDAMETLQNLYLAEDYMEEYKVTLTEDEEKAIEKAADAFLKANSKQVKDKISATKDVVSEYLRLMTIAKKVEKAVKAGADQNVSDKESARKKVSYVSFSKTKTDSNSQTVLMTDKEQKEVKKSAETFLKGAKETASLNLYAQAQKVTASTATFGADYEKDDTLTLPTEVYKAADKLKVNEYSKVIETESAYYVLQLESEKDAAATQEAKEAIITERENKLYQDTIKEWRKDSKIKVYNDVWKKVKMRDLDVVEKEEDVEKEEEATPSDAK